MHPRDHPRIRGEHEHMRIWKNNARRIIPAYAGSTPGANPCPASTTDHPRIRGEHPTWSARRWTSRGSSPHTRGAPHSLPTEGSRHRIIPAYAGSTSNPSCTGAGGTDHPRIRGEHPHPSAPSQIHEGSSPHTRGAHPSTKLSTSHPRIIPAYAGSTCRKSTALSTSTGSSPHTRGAHPHRRRLAR